MKGKRDGKVKNGAILRDKRENKKKQWNEEKERLNETRPRISSTFSTLSTPRTSSTFSDHNVELP